MSARVPVVVERSWPDRVSLETIAAFDRREQKCISANHARAVLHALRAEGRSSICIYEAPDAEAMRRVADTLKVKPVPLVWSSTEHHDSNSGRPALLLVEGESTIGMVERDFGQPTSFERAQAIELASAGCLTINRVRFLRSYLAHDGKRMLCLYAAPDLEAIRTASRMVGLPMSGVLNVLIRTPE